MDDILSAALDYAGRGWPVFPLLPETKRPYKGSNGVKDATTDAGLIRQWWTETPRDNIGLAMGRDAGVIALDVDPAHGGDKSLSTLESTHGAIPQTVESMTGGGGRHVLFKHPGGEIRNSIGSLGDGLDLKADGGYIVAPPSVHPSGTVYEWRNPPGSTPIAPAPEWLRSRSHDTEAIFASAVSAFSVSAPTDWPEIRARTLPTGHGQRNGLLLDLARGIKFNLGLSGSSPSSLKPYVREWFDQARPHVKTQDFDTTWFDFLHAWERARYSLGFDFAMIAHETAKTQPMPDRASAFENPDMQQLVATCAQLQRMRGDEPFSLSCSQVAGLLWGDCSESAPDQWQQRRRKANRWLRGLCREGVLEVIVPGKPGPPGTPASKYRYTGAEGQTG